jgi:hypothetical protein
VSRPWLTALGTGVALLLLTVALLNTRLDSLTDLPYPLAHRSPYWLAWRLLLYGAIATLWWQVDRQRTDPAARHAWRRLGSVCAVLILATELTRGMRA